MCRLSDVSVFTLKWTILRGCFLGSIFMTFKQFLSKDNLIYFPMSCFKYSIYILIFNVIAKEITQHFIDISKTFLSEMWEQDIPFRINRKYGITKKHIYIKVHVVYPLSPLLKTSSVTDLILPNYFFFAWSEEDETVYYQTADFLCANWFQLPPFVNFYFRFRNR